MTDTARRVLETCRHAYGVYETAPPSGPEWVLHWVASVALLRTIGHALHNVDAETSTRHERAINAAWATLQEGKNKAENRIFFKFIEEVRNNIVKEFELHAGQGLTVPPGSGLPHLYYYP